MSAALGARARDLGDEDLGSRVKGGGPRSVTREGRIKNPTGWDVGRRTDQL